VKTAFLSFHFDRPDKDVAAQVQTLAESQDLRPITGEHLGGGQIAPEVEKRIRNCDAFIAVAMPDPTQPRGAKFNTYDWIGSELAFARGQGKPTAILVHKDVELGAGLYAGAERINYDPNDPLPSFLKLAATIGVWKSDAGRWVTLALMNDELLDAVDALAGDFQNTRCEFRLHRGNAPPPQDWTPSYLSGQVGATVAKIHGVQDDDLIEVRVTVNGQLYYSRAEPQLVKVQMKKRG